MKDMRGIERETVMRHMKDMRQKKESSYKLVKEYGYLIMLVSYVCLE